jgi:hypothetical protein
MVAFFNILDHACTTCFVFANPFGKYFQSLFANSQRYMNKIARSIFKIWDFLPCFKCFSFDLNKTPPGWNSPLSVQEGFTNFCKYQLKEDQIFLDTNLKNTYQLKIYQFWNMSIKFFRKVVVRSFCFGLNISPPLALIAKNGVFWEPFYFLSHWY